MSITSVRVPDGVCEDAATLTTSEGLIVTKDADFHETSLLRGFSPKVVWLRMGTLPTKSCAGVFEAQCRANSTVRTRRCTFVLILS